jgi:N-hydroxyarylamine O-acetyltransferase
LRLAWRLFYNRAEEKGAARMADDIDLDAYFARIGYTGAPAADLATLGALHRLHPAAIPFENLDPLMGRRVHLGMEALQRKLVARKRGGYCFEQNRLFAQALTAVGFKVTGLAARVCMGNPPELARRSHMLLRIDLPEGPHIADVGLGSRTLSAALRLDTQEPQRTEHGMLRLLRAGDYFDQQALVEDAWLTLYRFSLEEAYPQDYEVHNWFTATHPDSQFTTHLMASRLQPALRLGLWDNQLSIHRPGGVSERRVLGTPEEIAAVLAEDFGIALPEPRAELLRALAPLVSGPSTG